MKRIGSTIVLPQKFREKSVGEAENLYLGEEINFVNQGFINLWVGDEKLPNALLKITNLRCLKVLICTKGFIRYFGISPQYIVSNQITLMFLAFSLTINCFKNISSAEQTAHYLTCHIIIAKM